MKAKNKVKLFVIVLSAITMLAVPAMSQEKQADTMQFILEKVQADKKLLVAAIMKLTESEAKAFWPVYDSYQKTLKNLLDRSIKLVEIYAEKYENMTDQDAKALLDDYLAIEREHLKLLESFLPRFRKVIPEKKVFRYYQIENKMEDAMNFKISEEIPLVK